MTKYRVSEKGFRLSVGSVVRMNPDQAKNRLHRVAVVDVEVGEYRLKESLDFKVGEEFEMDALPKINLGMVDVVDVPAPKPPKAKAKAKTKAKAPAKMPGIE